MSEPNLPNELIYPVDLDNLHRGQLAELIFIRKAASLGFAVAKPWGEGERYDAIVRYHSMLWRVQVKSVLPKERSRSSYRIRTAGGRGLRHTPYSVDEIDFLVAYIFAQDLWYVFPASVIEHRESIIVNPGCQRSKYEPYREAWDLMKSPATAATETESPAHAAVAGT
ncbi:MAG TPA: group I intron-associated PD-(D/E)XK endonuclease [Terriglobales bacterium]